MLKHCKVVGVGGMDKVHGFHFFFNEAPGSVGKIWEKWEGKRKHKLYPSHRL